MATRAENLTLFGDVNNFWGTVPAAAAQRWTLRRVKLPFFFGSECTVKYTRTSFIKNKFHLSSWACIGKKKREKWFLYSGSTILYIFFGNTNIMYVPTRGDHVYTKIRVHRVFWIPTCTSKWKLQGVPSACDYWIIIFLGEVTSNKKYGLQWLRVICFPRSVYAFWKRNTH